MPHLDRAAQTYNINHHVSEWYENRLVMVR
jgi:hypothetical protein